MTTLTGHLSLYATQSLKSIDNWMNVVQGNIGGSLVTAFKEVELTYGGNITHELRATSGIKNGVQIAEQSLTTANTRLNWKQGEVISSTQETHFAIQGDGFFLLVKPDDVTPNYDRYPNATATSEDVFLTRAGDFHWAEVKDSAGNNVTGTVGELVLVNKQGLVVMTEDSSPVNGNVRPLRKSDFDNINIKARPSVFMPTKDAYPSAPNNIVDFDELEYSRYGSTVLKAPTATFMATLIAGSYGVLDRRQLGDDDGETRLIEKALEASNVKTERNITELAVMGKVYNGFVQLIKVYNSNLDEVLGFIR
ncbi:hypothetical protein EON78_07060 [bacterium]|nr:MAG: hypothetical protein EON78_07060 [bacterium]